MFPVLTKSYYFVKSFSQAVTGKHIEKGKRKLNPTKPSVYVIQKYYGHTNWLFIWHLQQLFLPLPSRYAQACLSPFPLHLRIFLSACVFSLMVVVRQCRVIEESSLCQAELSHGTLQFYHIIFPKVYYLYLRKGEYTFFFLLVFKNGLIQIHC